ncbi:MAG: SMP-30/gluconolactonase/LRE family protein [Pseudomonadota bacterium]|nr:SMP-30/gluconolactonase/LRE family protein [Pseudomonadota bacterium]
MDAPAYEVLDPRFAPCVVPGGRAERLWTGGKWTEGPAWFDVGFLVWSDIPNDRMLLWDEATNSTSIYRHPTNGSNGNTVDRHGRLITCEGLTRRVTRTELSGEISVLASHYKGLRLRAPNDVVEKSDGTVWFTDPSYGSGQLGEGDDEVGGCHVYRLEPSTGEMRQMTDDMVMPNGLAFSPDERHLYIVDTGSTNFADGPNHIRRFSLAADHSLTGGEVFAENAAKQFDGIRFDSDGHLWCAAEDGAHCYAADGTLIGKLKLPERGVNLTFGGREGKTLFLTATTSLYRVPVNARRP